MDWKDVEIDLAMWCAAQKERYTNFDNMHYHCTCPDQKVLEQSSSEALTALSEALEAGEYDGDWQKYLGPQNAI